MKLLVTGNIGYITTEFIKEAFPECQILLLGETALKSDRRKGISVHPMPHAEKEFEDIFKTYEFEGVIYFSNYLTFHGKKDGELETLRKVLHYYKGNTNSRLLYITGPEGLYEETTGSIANCIRFLLRFCVRRTFIPALTRRIISFNYFLKHSIKSRFSLKKHHLRKCIFLL